MIRKINITDAKALHLLTKNQLGYDVPFELTQKNLFKLLNDPDHHFFLGFEDDQTHEVIGYLHAEVYESLYSDISFNILALAVSKKHERTGIGHTLMNELEKESRKRHYTSIRLNSSTKREQAHMFYNAIGYDHDKTQKRFIKYL
ncbi:MAG: GNAT family N-acetyltransferase [Vagococcus sp.]